MCYFKMLLYVDLVIIDSVTVFPLIQLSPHTPFVWIVPVICPCQVLSPQSRAVWVSSI